MPTLQKWPSGRRRTDPVVSSDSCQCTRNLIILIFRGSTAAKRSLTSMMNRLSFTSAEIRKLEEVQHVGSVLKMEYGAILLYQNDQIWKTLKGESIQLQAPSTSRLLGCHSFPENSFCSSACCDIANESHQFRHICSMRLVLGYLKLNQHLLSVTDCARFDQVTVNRSMAERIWVPLGSSEVWISIELKGNLQLKKTRLKNTYLHRGMVATLIFMMYRDVPSQEDPTFGCVLISFNYEGDGITQFVIQIELNQFIYIYISIIYINHIISYHIKLLYTVYYIIP